MFRILVEDWSQVVYCHFVQFCCPWHHDITDLLVRKTRCNVNFSGLCHSVVVVICFSGIDSLLTHADRKSTCTSTWVFSFLLYFNSLSWQDLVFRIHASNSCFSSMQLAFQYLTRTTNSGKNWDPTSCLPDAIHSHPPTTTAQMHTNEHRDFRGNIFPICSCSAIDSQSSISTCLIQSTLLDRGSVIAQHQDKQSDGRRGWAILEAERKLR